MTSLCSFICVHSQRPLQCILRAVDVESRTAHVSRARRTTPADHGRLIVQTSPGQCVQPYNPPLPQKAAPTTAQQSATAVITSTCSVLLYRHTRAFLPL